MNTNQVVKIGAYPSLMALGVALYYLLGFLGFDAKAASHTSAILGAIAITLNGPAPGARLDANNLWGNSDEVIKYIRDESFLSLQQFERLESRDYAWIINLRISKMGGLLRSIAIMARAMKMNIPVIIEAQVGETSILTPVRPDHRQRLPKSRHRP